MIQKIDIKKFGLFKNYLWDATIGKDKVFRKLNVIYGRNYSGKTTLSRIFRCLENRTPNPKYIDGDFSISLNDGTRITQNNLGAFDSANKIRVYNSDFVREHLSWLHNDDGTIRPFTILGAKNIEIDKRIREIEETMGKEQGSNGLIFDLSEILKKYSLQKHEYDSKINELDGKLKEKAVKIKNNATIFNVPVYQINSIKSDIQGLTPASILAEEQSEEYKKLLKEESKGKLHRLIEAKPNFSLYYTKAEDLLKRHIKPSQPITDLINDSLLQEWVRQGIERHKGNRKTCGFCGNTLPIDLWEKLNAHFSKESEELRKEIKVQIEGLKVANSKLENYFSLTKESFYSSFTSRFIDLNIKWVSVSKAYSQSIDALIGSLQERENDIFKSIILTKINDESANVIAVIKEINLLIDENNLKSDTLVTDQKKARDLLRLSEVAQYVKDIDYAKRTDEIQKLKKTYSEIEVEKNRLQKNIDLLNEEKRALEAQAKDESKGAELVNNHLTHFFGHNELKLVAEGESPNIRFKIIRDNIEANNLSEGECSLISFCYFIAKMEDELKDELNNNKLIIYIDDPISSLDSNHIFFMFSLIEGVIAKPKKYGQLFISTHNLDFLKYLKKLTIPEKYQSSPTVRKASGLIHFVIERKSKSNALLNLAPTYLKEYITEFNYLFDQIHKCSTADEETIAHNYQYNFGNNMRKFLEAYLFYKYPSHILSLDQRLDKFFDSDFVAINLINRVVNEYSHLGEQFDRGLEPIDLDAISKISKAVIEKIRTSDPEQYAALIESISMPIDE